MNGTNPDAGAAIPPESPPPVPPPVPAPQSRRSLYKVELVREELLNTVYLYTVVLAPAKGNDSLKGNRLARVEIARLTKEQAEPFEIGGEVNLPIQILVP